MLHRCLVECFKTCTTSTPFALSTTFEPFIQFNNASQYITHLFPNISETLLSSTTVYLVLNMISFCDVCTLTCVLVMQNRVSDGNIVLIMQSKSNALQVHQWGFVYCIIGLCDSYFKASFYSIKLYFVSENMFFFM